MGVRVLLEVLCSIAGGTQKMSENKEKEAVGLKNTAKTEKTTCYLLCRVNKPSRFFIKMLLEDVALYSSIL